MQAAQAIPLQTGHFRPRAADKTLTRLLNPCPVFALHNPYSEHRPVIEAYIARQFNRIYDARVAEFLPRLISMQCRGRVSAAAGIRPADQDSLFVEQYLDQPAEQALTQLLQTPVARRNIIEVGNLAATHRGASQLFLVLTTAIMREAGFRWGVFSATRQVEKIIRKMNFAVSTLGRADPARLGGDAARWGRYYETNPRVLVIDIIDTEKRLRRSLLSDAAMTLFADTVAELGGRLRPSAVQ